MRCLLSTCLFILGLFTNDIAGQCDPMPVITGDTLLCPNGETTLMTVEAYDSYQWYKRGYFDSVMTAIDGANGRTLEVTSEEALSYFSCQVNEDTCTAFTPEVLLDAYAFLLPVVSSTGDFEIDNMGNSIICEGDTMFFTLLSPYDTSITWFKNGNSIPGENGNKLTVTMEGNYSVQGAPSVCPDYIQSLGVTLTVIEDDCSTSLDDQHKQIITVYPNPARDQFTLEGIHSLQEVVLSDMKGHMIKRWTNKQAQNNFDITGITPGTYILKIKAKGKSIIKKLIVE